MNLSRTASTNVLRSLVVGALLAVTFVGGQQSTSAVASSAPVAAEATPSGSEDAAAAAYYRALVKNTPWLESYWDSASGHYLRGGAGSGGSTADFNFVGVMGNAVLLNYGTYDSALAGVSRAVLKQHTISTIAYYSKTNRWVDPNGDWGAKIYFDSTFETYFVDAAKLMWADLDATTRSNIDTIIKDEANYVVSLGTANDPRSPGWTTNGLLGNYQGDTKLEEMGARTMPLSSALAFLPSDPEAAQWAQWLDRWASNMDGLPVADQANATVIDGQPVSAWNTAHNIYDTFIVENHGSYAPNYQEASGDYAGRDVAQFVLADRPAPTILHGVPNDAELWQTLSQTGTDAGVAADFAAADRHHLYGKNVLSLAYENIVQSNPYEARAEQMLIDHLDPYQDYPPAGRLTKFSGQANYEPEARANLAQAYLLHYWRARFGPQPSSVTKDQYFAHSSAAKDYGSQVGLVAQQTPEALTAAVTKPGYVKFAFMPQHDDWFLDSSGSHPQMLPSTTMSVTRQSARVYQSIRDGYDASATVIKTAAGAYAGYTTLPTGAAVYATTGTAANEGALSYYNMTMPGIPGLDGNRTFYGADGSFTLAPGDVTPPDGSGVGDGYQDLVTFPTANVRYVRMYGLRAGTQYGYSLYSLETRNGQGGKDLAQGQPTTASSAYPGYPPSNATDGIATTRWANSIAGRSNPNGWLTVDLGSSQQIDRTTLQWQEQAAYGASYEIQGSTDGTQWTTLASVEATVPGRAVSGNWLNIDNRAGFVVRGSQNQIMAAPTQATLSAGPPSGSQNMIVEEYPGSATQTADKASQPSPSGGPPTLRASLADGYLSLFDLSDQPVQDADLHLPQESAPALFLGTQTVYPGHSDYRVDIGAGQARVEAPRFQVSWDSGVSGHDVTATVTDSQHVQLSLPTGAAPTGLTLTSSATGESHHVKISAGTTTTVVFSQGSLTPTPNLATGRRTFPTSPLPAGSTDPDLAVDGDPATSWVPGAAGRMVVDLGSSASIPVARLQWVHGTVRPFDIEVSADGLTWTTATTSDGNDADAHRVRLDASARYVAIQVKGWQPGNAELAGLYLGP